MSSAHHDDEISHVATIKVLLQGTVTADQVKSLLTAKLQNVFGSVAPDTSIDADFLMTAFSEALSVCESSSLKKRSPLSRGLLR